MSKRLILIIMAGAFLCLPLASAWAELLNVPMGVAYYDPTRAYNGVTVLGMSTGRTAYMIDMDGRLIRKWTTTGTLWQNRLDEDGNLSADTVPSTPPGGASWSGGGASGQIEEIAWDGTTHKLTMLTWDSDARNHHDYMKIWNKKLQAYTYLCVMWVRKSNAQMSAAGCQILPGSDQGIDGLYEYLPNYATGSGGTVVWKWSFMEHVCQSVNPSLSTAPVIGPGTNPTTGYVYNHYVTNVFNTPNKIDANTVTSTRKGPITDWQHINSMGYNADLGYIVINSREWNEFFVIDHDGTFVDASNYQNNFDAAASSSGDFLYRFGSPRNYNAPNFTIGSTSYSNEPGWNSNGSMQINGLHCIHFIPDYFYMDGGSPPKPLGPSMANVGAGHMLGFDNHTTNDSAFGGYTQIIEVNPYVSGWNGNYMTGSSWVWPHNAPYLNATTVGTGALGAGYVHLSRQMVWRYRPLSMGQLFSGHISGTERLPNGNTLIDAAETTHILEVTAGSGLNDPSEAADGTSPQAVWEYNYPASATQLAQLNSGGGSPTFRCYRYDLGHPAVSGHLQMDPTTYVISLKAGETQQTGYGKTLNSQTPCRGIPCQEQ